MGIYQQTQVAVNNAYKIMLNNNVNNVNYYYRWRIYESVMEADKILGLKIFKKLAIISARYVLPIWQNTSHDNRWPESILDMSEAHLKGEISLEILSNETNLFWNFMEQFGIIQENEKPFDYHVFYAGTAALEASCEVCGKIPYEDLILESDVADEVADIWTSDTACWAASAFAGRQGTSDIDPEKNKFFWTWWLNEAIPTAMNAV